MPEVGSFRTSLSGFHKKDVLSYIDELNARYAEERQQLLTELNTSRKHLTEVEQTLRQTTQQLSLYTVTTDNLKNKEREVAEMHVQNETLFARVQQLERENQAFAQTAQRQRQAAQMLSVKGRDYWQLAQNCAADCLTGMEDALALLEQQVAVSRENMEQVRQEMVQTGAENEACLEELGAQMEDAYDAAVIDL